jgi:hypothetical protein
VCVPPEEGVGADRRAFLRVTLFGDTAYPLTFH